MITAVTGAAGNLVVHGLGGPKFITEGIGARAGSA